MMFLEEVIIFELTLIYYYWAIIEKYFDNSDVVLAKKELFKELGQYFLERFNLYDLKTSLRFRIIQLINQFNFNLDFKIY